MGLLQTITEQRPVRRRRSWVYVSPRRRSASVLVLALLVTAVYGYWYATNERRVRRLAQEYLESLGATAEIESAKFRLFGGVELRGVKVYLPQWESPLLSASLVTLRHRPRGLFFEARLDVTQIVCLDAVVNIEKDLDTERYNVFDLLGDSPMPEAPRSPAEGGLSLPEISVREAIVQFNDVSDQFVIRRNRMKINVSAVPDGPAQYRVMVEQKDLPREVEDATQPAAETDAPIFGRLLVDLRTGTVSGSMSIEPERMERGLSARVGEWRRRYGVEGRIRVDATWDPSNPQHQLLTAHLQKVAFRLPDEEGGVRLQDVDGTVVFTRGGVRIAGVSGRDERGGRFELRGESQGYDPNAPFTLDLRATDAVIPPPTGAHGQFARTLRYLHEGLQPQGRWDVHVRLRRGESGEIDANGTIHAKGVSITERSFPYRVDDLWGRITFEGTKLTVEKLTGRHGTGRIEIAGSVDERREGRWRHFHIRATDVPMDGELRAALPPHDAAVFDLLQPGGRASAVIRVDQTPDTKERIEVDLHLDGHGSFEFVGFPYPLENVSGLIEYRPEVVRLHSLASVSGQTRWLVNGTVIPHRLAKDVKVDLTVDIQKMPLDERLKRALKEEGEVLWRTLRPSGLAERVRAHVTHENGKVDYDVFVRMAGGEMTFEGFPYTMSDVSATMDITPHRVVVRDFRGRQGQTTTEGHGEVYLYEGRVGADLRFEARDLTFDANLATAVPEYVRTAWEEFAPAGVADVGFHVRFRPPEDPNHESYEVALRPRSMVMCYRDFPLPLRWTGGEAVATAEKVVLRDFAARDGNTEIVLNGEIQLGERAQDVNLSVRATNVPVNEDLVAALRRIDLPALATLQPGGTMDANLEQLHLWRPAAPAPGALPPTQPAGAGEEGPAWWWSLRGEAHLHDADFDILVGRRKLSGRLRGTAGQTADGMVVESEIALDSLALGGRRLTEVKGRVAKAAGTSIVGIRDLVGKVHGGRLAGFAEVRLSDPVEYGMRMSMDRIDLADLINAGVTDPNERRDVAGRLSGTIEVTATEGPKPERQAAGQIVITEAKLVRMPILLDMLNVIYLGLPQGWIFQEAYLTYHLRDGRLIFQEIYLVGEGTSFLGSGTMEMATGKLDLVFLAGPPTKMPRISRLAEEFVQGIVREMVEWRVTGTVEKPQFRTVPLRALDGILDSLLNPGK